MLYLKFDVDDQMWLHIRPTGRRQISKSDTIYFHYNFQPTDNLSDCKADL